MQATFSFETSTIIYWTIRCLKLQGRSLPLNTKTEHPRTKPEPRRPQHEFSSPWKPRFSHRWYSDTVTLWTVSRRVISYVVTCWVTRHGAWIGNWIYCTLITHNYKELSYNFTIHYSTHYVFSVCCVFITCSLATASNTVDSLASVFTSLLATDCLIGPHGRNYWPLTPSRHGSVFTEPLPSNRRLLCLR
jgi:hypothetical protein